MAIGFSTANFVKNLLTIYMINQKGGIMIKLADFEESLKRYKKYYPYVCEEKTDIEILLYRKLINQKEAEELKKELLPPKSNAGGAGKIKKERPYTDKQVIKLGKDVYKDFKADNPNTDIGQVAFDLAESILSNNKKLIAFFKQGGIIEKNQQIACFADYIVE